MKVHYKVAVLACSVLVAGSCQQSHEAAEVRPNPALGQVPKQETAMPDVDFSAIIRQVHFAFRADGNGFAGGDISYRVRASDTGFTVTPRISSALPDTSGLTLQTTQIARGFSPPNAPARAAVDGDGTLVIEHGNAVEKLQNIEQGVEQSYRFDGRPTGEGDLVVRIHTSGMAYTGETNAGLHFADSGSGVGMRYSHAVWVDAQERRTDILAVFEGEEIVLRVPADVVDTSSFPAVLDPILGPEIGTDQPFFVEARTGTNRPAVASNGTDFFVVWDDARPISGNGIYGARMSATGVLLDHGGILIADTTGNQREPAIAFDGTNYFVAWRDSRNSATTMDDIYGARVTQNGVLLDPAGIPISTTGYSQLAPTVAFNGTDYLVAWEDGRTAGPADIYASRVTTNGAVLNPNGIALSTANLEQMNPVATSNGTDFFVVWADNRNTVNSSSSVYGTRVTAEGTVVDPNGYPIALYVSPGSARKDPYVAYSGSNYFVVWAEGCEVRGQRFDPTTLQAIDVSPLQIMPCSVQVEDITTAYGNGYYFVAWLSHASNATAIRGTWVNASTGVVTNPNTSPVLLSLSGTTNYNYSAMAFNGTKFLVATRKYSAGPLHGTLVGMPGMPNTLTKGIVVADVASRQESPAVDFDGSQWMVAWTDSRTTDGDIYAVRIDASGQVLDPSGIAVATSASAQESVAISHDPQNFFLVWADDGTGDGYDIYGARVSRSTGAVLDPPVGTAISTAFNDQRYPDVAFDGTNYLVVWEDTRTSSIPDIYGARVQPSNGVPLELGGFPIAVASDRQDGAKVAFDGARYLVVFRHTNSGTGADIYGRRVEPNGTVLDPSWIAISNYASSQHMPDVAYGAQQYVVVWADQRTSGNDNDLYGARVDPNGTVLDPTGKLIISSVGQYEYYPAVTFDGYNFVTAWHRLNQYQTYVTWVRPDLSSPGPNSSILIGGEQITGIPAITADGAGHSLVAYQREEPNPPYGNIRVWARLMSLGAAIGTTCTSGSDCMSGYCSDGVCCESACGNGAVDCQACSVAAGAVADGTCSPALQGTVCRVAAGVCDVAEVCNGAAMLCPANGFIAAATECRASTGPCDPAESCNGASAVCPADAKLPNGGSCNDGSLCTVMDKCNAGVCVGTNVTCGAPNQCQTAGVCNAMTGLCVFPPLPNGTTCTDNNACTQSDSCQAGVCTSGTPVSCTALDQCHDAGVCSPATGVCSNPNKPNGANCTDNNACTQTDSCQAGSCTGGNAVICAAQDQCHDVGVCSPATGVCSNPNKPDGANCTDNNACTQMDSCQAGVCSSGTPVNCTAVDQCHDGGVCSPATGLCSNPNKPNGATCSDNNACTQTDSCQAGSCTGGNVVICAAQDQCHNAGVCSPATGVCSNPNKPDGVNCNDNDACTQTDSCQAGSCTGGNAVICAAPDQCHDAGVCSPATGVCSNPNKPDGATCTDNNACTQTDTCQNGACAGDNAVVCMAQDACHDVGTCDGQTGLCSSPVKMDGAVCDDGDACTQSDTCNTGACKGADPVSCPPMGECYQNGTCNAATGACMNAPKSDGTPCNGGTCEGGSCIPSGGVSSSSTGTGGGGGATSSSSGTGGGGGAAGSGATSSSSTGTGGGGAAGSGATSSSSTGTGGAAGGGATSSSSTGTGGAAGSGATGGTGGVSSGEGGRGNTTPEQAGGCDCGVAAQPAGGTLWAAIAGLLATRRRRSRRAAASQEKQST